MEKIKKTVLLIGTLMLALSCSYNHNKNSNNLEKFIYLEINNDELKKQIISYNKMIESSASKDPYIISVLFKQINDSISKFYISEELNSFSLEDTPFFLIQVDTLDVFFTIDGMNNFFEYEKSFFKMKEEIIIEVLKKYFKDDYDFYLRDKELHVSVLGSCEIWELTFLRDSLMSKEVSIN